MTESTKATRALVQIGSMTVDGFILPDGSYQMPLTQTEESVGKPARNTFDFLRSKALKRLLSEAEGTFTFLPFDTVLAISLDTYNEALSHDQSKSKGGRHHDPSY